MAATAVKRPPKVDVDLMFLLGQASHALETEMTAKLHALGISPRAHCVLAHARGGELTQSQVAEQCALDKTTMVVTMDELERAGLAERRPSSTDRRARIIAVTQAGERIVLVFEGSASASPPTSSPDSVSSFMMASTSAMSASPSAPRNVARVSALS